MPLNQFASLAIEMDNDSNLTDLVTLSSWVVEGPHWTKEVCLDGEIFNQDGIEREERREANFLLLTFVLLSFSLVSFFQCLCISPRAGQSASHPQQVIAGEWWTLAPHSPTVMDSTSKHAGFGRIPRILVGR